MPIDPKQFEEELADCGGDLSLWSDRKERENRTFYGFEINPEKEKQLNRIRKMCRQLHELAGSVKFMDYPLKPENRNGMAQISLNWLFLAEDGVKDILSQLFAAADTVTISSPFCAYDEQLDGDDVPEKRVFITFDVLDMWNTYGKGQFGV